MKGEEIRKVRTASAITLAILAAALGCVSPVVGVFTGMAGAADSRALDQWRPHSLVVAVALLGLSYFFTYRPARITAREPRSVRERPPSAGWSRRILPVAAALVVVSAFFPYYSGWLMRTVGRGPYTERHIRQQATARVVLTIEGMDCPMCAAGLQNNLRQVPGVRRAEVRFQDKQADLDYDPKTVEPERLAQVVAEAGFKVIGVLPVNK